MNLKKFQKVLTLTLEILENYSGLSLSRTRKGPRNLFEIERVRDREKKEISGYMINNKLLITVKSVT